MKEKRSWVQLIGDTAVEILRNDQKRITCFVVVGELHARGYTRKVDNRQIGRVLGRLCREGRLRRTSNYPLSVYELNGSSIIDIQCKWCGRYSLVRSGRTKTGRQIYLCNDCGHHISNPDSLPRHRFPKKLYNYAIRSLRSGASLRRTQMGLISRYGESPDHRKLGEWARKEGIALPSRTKFELDGHKKHMIRAKQLLQENPGLDWNLAQALVSKEDEIREHLNAEGDRIELEKMIDTFNKIYAQ